MFKISFVFSLFLCLAFSFRPPAVPLIVHDPYISIWSTSDELADDWPRHWTGGVTALSGMILIDGLCYRYMGPRTPYCYNKMTQNSLIVEATTTKYEFSEPNSKISMNLTFITPSNLKETEHLESYTSIIHFSVINNDDMSHKIYLYYDNSAEIVIASDSEPVIWETNNYQNMSYLKIGSAAQIFNADNKNDRINWGFWYIAFSSSDWDSTVNSDVNCRSSFARTQSLPDFDKNMPRPADKDWPVLALKREFQLIPGRGQNYHFMIGYDEGESIDYFGTKLKPYFSVKNPNYLDHLSYYFSNYESLIVSALKANEYVAKDFYTVDVGGNNKKFLEIANLAYRQVTGSLKVVYNQKTNEKWVFMKEISSDGDVSTIDVIFPASPILLLYNMDLMVDLLKPILAYANNETSQYGLNISYNRPWAPHHLGAWPVCDIRPDQQEDMPIEETANLLLIITYIMKNRPESHDYFNKYEALFTLWANYLVQNLPDPGDQLCTDDFEGPSPHNVNLAAKGILGIAAYAEMLEIWYQTKPALRYREKAKEYAQYWEKNAFAGDHYKLQYNLDADSWSQKYNLLFQKLLDLDIFSESVFKTEIEFYMKKLNKYGFALDNRANFTKLDWSFWSTAWGTGEQVSQVIDATYSFLNETTDRVPLTDWYLTDSPKMKGFQARPVVGGIWSRILMGSKRNERRDEVRSFIKK